MNKRGLYPHEVRRSVVDHGDEICGKGWIPCCPPTCSGAEGWWGLRCRLSLVSNSNGSLEIVSGCSPPSWRQLRGIYRWLWSMVLVKHRLGLTSTSRWRKLRPIGPWNGLQAGRPRLLLAPFGSIFRVRALLLILHLSPVVTLRQNISENVQFSVKMQHTPKSKTKSKTVKFGCKWRVSTWIFPKNLPKPLLII